MGASTRWGSGARPAGTGAAALGDLVEAIPDGLLLCEADGTISYANPSLLRMSGHTAEQLLGAPVEVLVPPDPRGRHARLHREFLGRAGARLMSESPDLTLLRRDGALVPVEIMLSVGELEGRRVSLAVVRDLTVRRALAERERLVSDALDAVSDGVVVVDAQTRERLYANAFVRRGWSRGDTGLASVPIGAPATEDDRRRVEAALDALASGTTTDLVIDTRVAEPDGTTRPVEMRLSLRPGPGGSPDGARIVVIARDVSDRLAAEQARLRSESGFRAAFEEAPIGMALLEVRDDGHRRFVRVNAAMAALFAEAAEDLVDRSIDDVTAPEDRESDTRLAADLAAGRLATVGRTKRYLRADGSQFWAEAHGARVEWPGDGRRLVLLQLVDVTARHRAERLRALRVASTSLLADVTTRILLGEPMARVHERVAAGVAEVFGASDVTLGVPFDGEGHFRLLGGVGPVAADLARGALRYPEHFVAWLAEHAPVAYDTPPAAVPPELAPRVGPGAAVRLGTRHLRAGVLQLSRPPGAAPFLGDELDLLVDIGRELGLAMELGEARGDQARLAVLENRQALARDLHDTVVQELIGVGMQLERERAAETDEARRAAMNGWIDHLDDAVRRLRSMIFQSQQAVARERLSHALAIVAAQAGRGLGFAPVLTVDGAVDELPASIGDEVLAVAQEALSNVLRHADARHVHIRVSVAAGVLELCVDDDGAGVDGSAVPGNGVANMRHRAERLGGGCVLSARDPVGTRLRWTVPVPGADDAAPAPRRTPQQRGPITPRR